ncbi:hypothetical protein [Pseudenterobacter timonensis]|uniref:O-antigen/teichoic acid export membrane protein n=1 Tax=Pseudenterobacter timonensis TaxID=1755099 RepID=A0ABV4A304_9ENTR
MNDLKLSLVFGIFTRVITFLNQILSVPLIITLIGLSEFTRYNVMTAGVAWLITLGGCLLPSIIGDIARACLDKDDETISKKVSSAFALMFTFCLIVVLVYSIFFSTLSIDTHAILFFSIIIIFASTAESIRQGLGENYKNSIYNGIANLLSLVGIFTLYFLKVKTNLLIILCVTLGSVAFLKLINLLPLLQYFNLRNIKFNHCKDMLVKALGFIMISVAYYCNTAGMITILGYTKYDAITDFVILQKIILIIMGIIVMVRNPLWGVIAKMKYKGGGAEIMNGFNKFLKIYFLFCPIIFITLYFGLNPFLALWAKGLSIDQLTITFYSLYILIMMLSYINSILYYGLEIFSSVSKLLIIEAVVNIVCVFILSKTGAPLYIIFIVMLCTSLSVSSIVYNLIKRTCANVN